MAFELWPLGLLYAEPTCFIAVELLKYRLQLIDTPAFLMGYFIYVWFWFWVST